MNIIYLQGLKRLQQQHPGLVLLPGEGEGLGRELCESY